MGRSFATLDTRAYAKNTDTAVQGQATVVLFIVEQNTICSRLEGEGGGGYVSSRVGSRVGSGG